MRDIFSDLNEWFASQEQVAQATVIQTWGSSPRQAGAKMAITASGKITGTVSGGCVEGAVVEAGMEVISSGRPKLLHFGVSDEDAWEVGLACGGEIEVFVEPLDRARYDFLRPAITENHPAATITVISGPEEQVGLRTALRFSEEDSPISYGDDLDQDIHSAVKEVLAEEKPKRLPLPDGSEVFIDLILPALTLIIVGGSHIAIPLTEIAKTLDYQTILIDPRKAFGNQTRFPQVDRIFQAWPKEAFAEITLTSSAAVVTLTHDPKIDDPALIIALSSPAFYVGALGSRQTQEKRRQRLLRQGLSVEQADKLHGPIGLDLGGRAPEEIALATMAQIVKARYRGE